MPERRAGRGHQGDDGPDRVGDRFGRRGHWPAGVIRACPARK
jgi:hypothetical protein